MTTARKFAGPAGTFFVMVSSAPSRGLRWGRHVRVGVVRSDTTPRTIRDTATAEVVRTWERRRVGLTARAADHVALAEAIALASSLAGVAS